ncbi:MULTISPECIES: NUDIX domain-containing protein [Halobacterium]|uniref:NUDIX domain-containing protein n=1 Tax=Halobacterium TaxID=2239 RepID=UPI0022773C6F|nr:MULTISPECIES: NUDIX domain-containing protein [Halobacterium]WJK64683.1 NUDIX domain-containing protein [Halobacterium salinarum]
MNVDAAVVRGDDYLVVKRSSEEEHAAGTLSFPGRKVDSDALGDAIRETARREDHDEVGVETGVVEYVTGSPFTANESTECLNVVVHCEYESGEPEVREPEEVADVFWLGYDELADHKDVPEQVREYADAVEASR